MAILKKASNVTAQKKRSRLMRKTDRLYQEAGRKLNTDCLVCSKPMVCLHHYVPKSRSTALRYDLKNGVPLCHGCHMQLHNGDPNIQNKINELNGIDWAKELDIKRQRAVREGFKPTLKWIQDKHDILEKIA